MAWVRRTGPLTRPWASARVLYVFAVLALGSAGSAVRAEDGYEVWLRYHLISDSTLLAEYRDAVTHLVIGADSPTLRAARAELAIGLKGLLGLDVGVEPSVLRDGALVAGTPAGSSLIASLPLASELADLGDEGFLIRATTVDGRRAIVIAANEDVGVLYGTFHLLRTIQMHGPLHDVSIASEPRIRHRLLNHWDNLDRTVERGYAGFSLWDWHKLPDYVSPRYKDYARANASLGINGTVLTNVNANAAVLLPEYLTKVAALADAFRPYGIRVYLTARFSAPIEIGGLETADPLDPAVREWWQRKTDEIYALVPDFGGFLVKANSEGQPGPQDYARSHADGANMLADAVAPHGGIVMWRAFVYADDPEALTPRDMRRAGAPSDRVRQAYDEFVPLDGSFRDNVFVQAKNGPLDFQPREPFHPLFGAMPETPLMLEFQITKEYLGFATHLVYLAPLFKEVLDADTYANGAGSTVARVVDGSLNRNPSPQQGEAGRGVLGESSRQARARTGIAGVSNIGTDRNWTGSHFTQANWYAFGRLAWDHTLSAEQIADEWIRMTFSNDAEVIEPVKAMMLASREALVNYMTPLGLHHLMARGHHYGPGPWVEGGPRADWTSVYYHRADTLGIGFDRTASGSDAVSQYSSPLRERFADRDSVPEELLLWFHRVRWDERMRSGRTLWEELVHRYHAGVDTVRWMQRTWDSLEGKIDERRFRDVRAFLRIQEKEAIWWRDASIAYFQTFSRMPIPDGYEPPAHSLEHYLSIESRFVPGN